MNTQIEVPVLLVAFNRPIYTQIVFEKIREAKPKKLYIIIDGPRQEKEGEIKLVENVKNIVQNINWTCEAHYKYNDTNLGAEITISTGVNWALENEDYIIVLEDDIIAPIAFFLFAEQMLIKYVNIKNVYMISGGQFTPFPIPNDYLFGVYGHTGCGWATWKRAWKRFDLNVNDFDNYLENDLLDSLVNCKMEKIYMQKFIKKMKEVGRGNITWDVCWLYIRFKEQGLSIIPKTNLTSNIGIIGFHSQGQTDCHFRDYDENFVAQNHPVQIKRNPDYDIYHLSNYLNKKDSYIKKIIKKISRI